jgi:signal transduction histidine kinase
MPDETLIQIIGVACTVPVFLSALLIWFIISYQNKKYQNETEKKDAQLREQALIIEQQEAIEKERNRIASEMHDELGSGLTIIQYLSDGVLHRTDDDTVKEDIRKIASYSTQLVRNMSEIIWAMNSRFDNVKDLVGYIRRNAAEFLEDNHMEHEFIADDYAETINISGEKRRNVYLVVKETIHNSVKYSKASKLRIEVSSQPDLVIKIIEVGGVGFDYESKISSGNGLYNIGNRMAQIKGSIQYQKTAEAMIITLSLPLGKEGSS